MAGLTDISEEDIMKENQAVGASSDETTASGEDNLVLFEYPFHCIRSFRS